MPRLSPWLPFLLLFPSISALSQSYEAGLEGGFPGLRSVTDGSMATARFHTPAGVCANGAGQVFVVDSSSNALRLLTIGVDVISFAGTSTPGRSDGIGAAASFFAPEGVAIDAAGTAYVADTKNHTIRKIAPNAEVTTFAGKGGIAGSTNGNGTAAEFASPTALAVTASGVVYVCDTGNHLIRKILPDGTVTTLAGTAGVSGNVNGNGTAAKFNAPRGIAVSDSGVIYVADSGNHTIRKITPAGLVSTFAGQAGKSGHKNDSGLKAQFASPSGLLMDAGANLIVSDTANHVIRRITPAGVVSTIAGTPGVPGARNGVGPAALFSSPRGISLGLAGVMYVADSGNGTIRRLSLKSPAAPTITSQPRPQTVNDNQQAIFKVAATGATPMVYQWMFNGVPITGATSPTYRVTGANPSNEGVYSVQVQNPWGTVTSIAAPLVLQKQATWLWISRYGGTSDDSVKALSLRNNVLWSAGFAGGHVMKRLSLPLALPQQTVLVSTKGDGANAVSADLTGAIFTGMDDPLQVGKPGLLTKHTSTGILKWRRQLATERGGVFSPTSNADVLTVAVDGTGEVATGGHFQGYGKFSGTVLGTPSHRSFRGMVGRYDGNGTLEWMRDIFSANDSGQTAIWSVAVDATNAVFAAGSAGPNSRVLRSSTPNDYHTLSSLNDASPLALKYDVDGSLLWVHSPDTEGMYFASVVDASGDLWVTGYEGDRYDPASQTAVLRRLDGATGNVIQGITLPHGKGCSVNIDPVRGVAWLLIDGAGMLSVNGRRFGLPGYRAVLLEPSTLLPKWDLPAFGNLTIGSESEQADLVFAPNGRLYAGLTFQEADQPNAATDFSGRARYSMKGRKKDGFVAVIGELPWFDEIPRSHLLQRGGSVTLTTTTLGDITPTFQWLKNGTALAGRTNSILELTNVQLSTAGSFQVRMGNGRDVVTSPAAKIAVVDTAPRSVSGKERGQLALTVPVAGEGLTFVWKKDGDPVSNLTGKISGATTNTLVIKNLAATDAGSYQCEVSSTITGTMLPGGTNEVTITP